MTELTTIDVVCEHCHVGLAQRSRISVEMKPGRDGIPWFLCLRCWLDGVRPMSRIGAPVGEAAPTSGIEPAHQANLPGAAQRNGKKKRKAS